MEPKIGCLSYPWVLHVDIWILVSTSVLYIVLESMQLIWIGAGYRQIHIFQRLHRCWSQTVKLSARFWQQDHKVAADDLHPPLKLGVTAEMPYQRRAPCSIKLNCLRRFLKGCHGLGNSFASYLQRFDESSGPPPGYTAQACE